MFSHTAEDVKDANTPVLPLSTSAEVRFDPDKYTFIVERGIDVGYRFNATIELYDVVELMTWQVRVYFNNTILNATNAYYHPDEPIHKVNHATVSPVIRNNYNSTHGYVQLAISAMYPDYVNVTAEDYPLGVGICIMEFEVLMVPSGGKRFETALTVDNSDTYLLWMDGETEIPSSKNNGLYSLISSTIKVPTDYPTIQEAINAAGTNCTIFVYNGTYLENVVVNKTLLLVGQSADLVFINGTGSYGILVDGIDNVTIRGFTVTGSDPGIWIRGSSWTSVYECKVEKNRSDGICVECNGISCLGLCLRNNTISDNGANGVRLYPSGWDNSAISDLVLRDSSLTENVGSGIEFSLFQYTYVDFHHWIICNNCISDNGGLGLNIYLYGWFSFSECVIFGNTINGNNVGGMSLRKGAYGGYFDSWNIGMNNISQNGNDGAYIDVGYSNRAANWEIHDNQISANTGNGMYLSICIQQYTYWSMYNNVFDGNAHGGLWIATWSQEQLNIRNNRLSSNVYGLHLEGGNHILRGNAMWNNTFNFGAYDAHDIDVSNTVNGRPIYYLLNKDGGSVPRDAGYVALFDSANVILSNLTLSDNEQGVLLVRTSNITVQNTCVSDNYYGYYVASSQNTTLSDLHATANTYGMFLTSSPNAMITDLNATDNTYGLFLASSSNNTITGNCLMQNTYGLYISSSSGNIAYHNNFLRNYHQATTEGSAIDMWNLTYPVGGNYWSNHTGPDECSGIYQNETGSDGIVDTNVTISQDNVDYYPLAAPWSSPINIILPGNTTYREIHDRTNDTYLTFIVDFDSSWIGYSLDGQANVTIEGNTTLSGLAYGYHSIIVYANDTYGYMHSSANVFFALTSATDVNYDGCVDAKDLGLVCYGYGSIPEDPNWKWRGDVNRDGIIDIEDIALVVRDYGKIWYPRAIPQ
jgi:parallel beta-helix repeat protein